MNRRCVSVSDCSNSGEELCSQDVSLVSLLAPEKKGSLEQRHFLVECRRHQKRHKKQGVRKTYSTTEIN